MSIYVDESATRCGSEAILIFFEGEGIGIFLQNILGHVDATVDGFVLVVVYG